MRIRFLAILLVIALSATLVGSVYAHSVSAKMSSSSLHLIGRVTGLQQQGVDELSVELEATLHGVAECNGHPVNFDDAHVSASTSDLNIHRGQRAEFTIDVDDDEIEAAIEADLNCDVHDWLVETLNATLTLLIDDEIHDTTNYDCRVNFNRPADPVLGQHANCNIFH